MGQSIITDELNICFICGRWGATDKHHCMHGTANRKLADKDGLWVMLCRDCHSRLHDKGDFDKDLQAIAEIKWKAHFKRSKEEFIERYGKSNAV